MNNKKNVALLFGGRSVEHGVSVNSARNIFEFIDRAKFQPVCIGLSTEGKWFLKSSVDKDIETGQEITLSTNPSKPGFISAGGFIKPDLVFPVLHGTDGEDGSIQGMLTALQIPFVGSGVLGSAVSMNKVIAKQVLQSNGLPVVPFESFRATEKNEIDFEKVSVKFGIPLMVKSASLGSSVGVSKIRTKEEFAAALEESFRYDDEVIIEKFIPGREIECAILGNEPPKASRPGEIIISKKYDFYNFDAKYVDAEAVEIKVPAELSVEIEDKVRSLCLRAFQALRCQDFARVDLFLSDHGIFINEINTIPGFTNSSMYPMMWKEQGLGFTDLISQLLILAEERWIKQNRFNRNFQSSLKF
ncbi:MAG: D-alanine--D-alanine ligase family protein [Cyclobacteriaceae bacterium]